MKVPLNDLKRRYQNAESEITESVTEVLSSGWYIKGKQVAAFETEMAEYLGCRHVKGVGSGTDALRVALIAAGVEPGDSVATVANAGAYASTAILSVGATPSLVEINSETLLIDPMSLKNKLTQGPAVKAVVITHLFGNVVDMDKILEICRQEKVAVIEDCAQSTGARWGDFRTGTFGDIGCFSFFPTKNLGAFGDGGCVVTNDDSTADRISSIAQYGWSKKYEIEMRGGFNTRLDEAQAAILRIFLKKLDTANTKRLEIVSRYKKAAISKKNISIKTQDTPGSAAHLCVVESENRDNLREYLTSCGIGTDVHYPVPDHRQQAFDTYEFANISLPVTELMQEKIVTIPCFPEMTEEEVDVVCQALAEYS